MWRNANVVKNTDIFRLLYSGNNAKNFDSVIVHRIKFFLDKQFLHFPCYLPKVVVRYAERSHNSHKGCNGKPVPSVSSIKKKKKYDSGIEIYRRSRITEKYQKTYKKNISNSIYYLNNSLKRLQNKYFNVPNVFEYPAIIVSINIYFQITTIIFINWPKIYFIR